MFLVLNESWLLEMRYNIYKHFTENEMFVHIHFWNMNLHVNPLCQQFILSLLISSFLFPPNTYAVYLNVQQILLWYCSMTFSSSMHVLWMEWKTCRAEENLHKLKVKEMSDLCESYSRLNTACVRS